MTLYPCHLYTYISTLQASEAVKFSAEILESNPPTSGVYEISDVCGGKVHAFHDNVLTQQAHCNMEDNDGGWTVILRRKLDVSKRVNFTRSWDEYVHGFGDLNTEFWYGLRNIHCLTTREQVDLQVLLNLSSGTSHLWTYHHFVVDRPEDKYTLHIGEAEGPSGFRDTMAHHNGRPFSTYDNDNDPASAVPYILPMVMEVGGGMVPVVIMNRLVHAQGLTMVSGSFLTTLK